MPKPTFRKKKQPPVIHRCSVKGCCEPAMKGPPPWDFRSTVIKGDKGSFTINDALRSAKKCRAMCTLEEWEDQVCRPLIEDWYSKGQQVKIIEGELAGCLDETYLEMVYNSGIQVSRTHQEIARVLFTRESGANYTKYWNLLSAKRKEEYVMFALATATRSNTTLKDRHLVPDLNMDVAQGDNFLDLLRFILDSAVNFPEGKDYLRVPCAAFEHRYRVDEIRDNEELPHHLRNQTIANFVLEMISVWRTFSQPEELVGSVVSKPVANYCCGFSRFPRSDATARNITFEIMQTLDEEAVEEPESCETSRKEIEYCRACRRRTDEIPEYVTDPEKKFMYCQNCRKQTRRGSGRKRTSRKVPYCSIECQESDWELGDHKTFCGKRFTELGLPFPGELSPTLPSPPSLSLLWQLWQNQHDTVSQYADRGPSAFEILYRFENVGSSRSRNIVLLTPQLQHLKPLMAQAVKTRSERDIEAFILAFASITGTNSKLKDGFIDQLVEDWIEVGRKEIEEWVEKGWKIAEEELISKKIKMILRMQGYPDEEEDDGVILPDIEF